MNTLKNNLNDKIERLQTGEVKPGSKEGIAIIREVATQSPTDLITKLFAVPNQFLEKGMRLAGIPEDDIERYLRMEEESKSPEDPFASETELQMKVPDYFNPELEFDPAADMRNGPHPR